MTFPLKKVGFFVVFVLYMSCKSSTTQEADLIIKNASIYTVDESMPMASVMAIKEGKILYIGTDAELEKYKGASTEVHDLKGAFVMPGFIEGHGHFSGMGSSLINLNLLNARNWEEIIHHVEGKLTSVSKNDWIMGRGWHQEKWDNNLDMKVNGYPYHDKLSAITKDNPVILFHASGHALFANKKAMDMANINRETADPEGGRIVRDNLGEAIGVFEERAMDLIRGPYEDFIKSLNEKEQTARWYKSIRAAQDECLKYGITSFQDAGSKFFELERFKQMEADDSLDIRLWVMARHSYRDMKDKLKKYKHIGDFYTCNAIKSEVDGALGSFGAWLLAPYSDKPGFVGQNTTPISEVENIATLAKDLDMQMCVHAIGDKANKVVIDIFEKLTKDSEKNRRWRIEHAQHIDTSDIPRMKANNIIASMQGIHCTSDAPFVEKRLGKFRSEHGAYAWRSFLNAGVVIANGTDVPVEEIDPFKNLYASVTRKRLDNDFEFYIEQRMTRKEAIYSYTLGNAFAAFEEEKKGSLTAGKFADFIVLSKNLSTCKDEEIPSIQVKCTVVGGKVKYGSLRMNME